MARPTSSLVQLPPTRCPTRRLACVGNILPSIYHSDIIALFSDTQSESALTGRPWLSTSGRSRKTLNDGGGFHAYLCRQTRRAGEEMGPDRRQWPRRRSAGDDHRHAPQG